jgi:hypothetical protein
MLPQGTHERLPFVIRNYILRLVVGGEALIFHVRFIDDIGAVGIILFAVAFERTFLQYLS